MQKSSKYVYLCKTVNRVTLKMLLRSDALGYKVQTYPILNRMAVLFKFDYVCKFPGLFQQHTSGLLKSFTHFCYKHNMALEQNHKQLMLLFIWVFAGYDRNMVKKKHIMTL